MTRQMVTPSFSVQVRLRRGGPQQPGGYRWQELTVEVPGDYTVIELVEMIKGEKEPSLVYRHSCHHGSCGTCAMRINGIERLACITGVAEVCEPGGTLTIEPLANLPVVADLANDPGPLMEWLELLGPGHVRSNGEQQPPLPDEDAECECEPFCRFADCIECGACISACPGAKPGVGYIGPAPLAAARETFLCGKEPLEGWSKWLDYVGGEHGIWQCHHVFECSRVCPAGVDVAGAIMDLRRLMLAGQMPVHVKGGTGRG